MEKTITRKLGFSRDELYDAVLADLRNRDHAYPLHKSQVKFVLTETGATLEWTEDSETN